MPDGDRQHFEGGGDARDVVAPVDTSAQKQMVNPNYQPGLPFNEATDTLKSINPDITSLYQSELGRTPDPSGASYWQRMYDAGMSLDQIKYNMDQSTEYQKAHPTTESLKGQPLTYDPSKWQLPQTPVLNRYGSYSGADFTPLPPQTTGKGPSTQNMGYQQQPMGYGYQQPMNYGYQQPVMGGYGYGNTYGGQLGYQQQPMSNYGMPNFGSSSQYNGAPNYAGAMQYGGQQYQMPQYGMPQYGGGYGVPQYGGYQQQYQQPQQQMPTAGGKGPSTPAPTPAPTTPPTAGGKGPSTSTPTTSTPPTAGGKGPTPSGGAYARGGRTGYAKGGADAAALKNYIDTMSNNPSLMALAAQQQSGYSSLPGAHLPGPYGVQINPTQPHQLMTASAQLGPQQTAMGTINQAAQFGNSVSSLADGAEKLKNKLIAEPGSEKGWLDKLMSSDTIPSAETYTSVTPPARPEIFNKGGQVGR